MMHAKNRSRAWPIAIALAALTACDGSSKVGQVGQDGDQASLASVEVGRLVDVYSFRLASTDANPDRRRRANRRIELIATDVVINPAIESESLFDAAGNPVSTANYEFLPFDKAVGHEQLLILWDDQPGSSEQANFDAALANAQSGLLQLPASYRNQNTATRAIPIVPRNAAIKLNFTAPLNVSPDFFVANPSAVQVLEFKGDPDVVDPVNAFRILPYRVVTKENDTAVILDTTILGGEAGGGITSPGLPLSSDQVTANIRIAIPVRGSVLSNFYVDRDGVADLNGVDSAGRESVIRDFRSGNLVDDIDGRLSEPDEPKIVASLPMGITAVDAQAQTVTINKDFNFVPIRGRYPFVDGPLSGAAGDPLSTRTPLGPQDVPIQRALRAGDLLTQDVVVEVNGSFETVTLRSEVLENLSIISTAGDPNVGKADDGSGTGTFDQGAFLPQVTLRLATVEPARDSLGRPVRFRANSTPLGEECTLRTIYVENVPFNSSGSVSDRLWRSLFLRIEPSPGATGVDVQPNASISVEFTKPMDLDQIDNTANFLVTKPDENNPAESFLEQMGDAKRATTRVVPTRLTDLSGDGTVLRLQPQLGFAHEAGEAEVYSVHVRLRDGGVTDLAGNGVQIFDDLSAPQDAWSVNFQLDPGANSNLVGWHTYMFTEEDEDGTLPGSADMFGQWRLENGRLFAASGVRTSRSASNANLGTISRITRGECWDSGLDNPDGYPGTEGTPDQLIPPVSPPPPLTVDAQTFWVPDGHTGSLYWAPQMVDTVNVPNIPLPYPQTPQPVGRVVEPLSPQGSRMQMRYIEEDFSLSYTQPSEFGLDVEQLYWSPYNDETVLFDEFDRFTMSLGHARTRGDERWLLGIDAADPPASWCVLDCGSMNSGLSSIFADNVLEGSSMVTVFEDKVYAVNPNEAFRDDAQVTYVPFPRFDRSYTWRDSRLVTQDATGTVIGLGGAQNPGANPPNNDTTADIDSPWITSVPDDSFLQFGSGIWVKDGGDFVGNNQRDHDPISLPLLVDVMVFPDDPATGVVAGSNALQVAMLGQPSNWALGNPGGYYDAVAAGCEGARPPWPRLRVHATGGFDPSNPNTAVLVDPANVLGATGNVIKEAGAVLLGGSLQTALTPVQAGDGMLNWARADFVRKVSTVTFGFFDTLQPQRALIVDENQAVQPEAGFPNWLGVNPLLRMTDVLVQLDPPQTRQPAGTSVVVELRGAETIFNADVLYNPIFDGGAANPADDTLPDFAATPPENGRGNLLNANYACEAYRYSTPNVNSSPRIATTGLTRYVTDDQVEAIRDPATGLYPRFLNVRLVMQNNVDVSPALSPSLRSMSVVYRLAPGQ